MDQFWARANQEFSSEDVNAVLDNWKYIQIIADRKDDGKECLEPPVSEGGDPYNLMSYDSNWLIQYWNGTEELASMMTCSVGEAFIGGLSLDYSSGLGTDIAHAAKAAITMVHYASLQKWPGIIIIEGSDFLKWVIWATADTYNIPCSGYQPDAEAVAKKERCEYLLSAFRGEERMVQMAPVPSLGGYGDYPEDDDDGLT